MTEKQFKKLALWLIYFGVASYAPIELTRLLILISRGVQIYVPAPGLPLPVEIFGIWLGYAILGYLTFSIYRRI